jgi:hypothetical protein
LLFTLIDNFKVWQIVMGLIQIVIACCICKTAIKIVWHPKGILNTNRPWILLMIILFKSGRLNEHKNAKY